MPSSPGSAVTIAVLPRRAPATDREASARPAFAEPTMPPDWVAPARVIAAIQTMAAIRSASSATRPTWRIVATPLDPVPIESPHSRHPPPIGGVAAIVSPDIRDAHGLFVRPGPPEVSPEPHHNPPDGRATTASRC